MDKENLPNRKRTVDISTEDQLPKKILRSTLTVFDWKSLCFFCGCKKKKGNSVLHRISPIENLKNIILQVAVRKNDLELQNRLELLGEFDLAEVGAVYHKNPCYNSFFTSSKKEVLNVDIENSQAQPSGSQNQETNNDNNNSHDCGSDILEFDENDDSDLAVENKSLYSYNDIMIMTLDTLKDRFINFEVIALTEICSIFRQFLFDKCGKKSSVRSTYLKSIISRFANDYNIVFYSEEGLPDLVCLSDIPTHYFVRKIYNLSSQKEKLENEVDAKKDISTDIENDSSINIQQSEQLLLYNAVRILRNNISEIKQTQYYPTVDEVELESSRKFVPHNLQLFFSWLIDQEAYTRAVIISNNDTNNQRRMLTLSECIIFSSNSPSSIIIPPFHFGLTLQMHHEFGSKFLIDTLNSYGFCATYDELRRFLTALAKVQIKKNDKVYVPPKIISQIEGGCMIQEGADNVDICTETIDGKDTYHAMARVVFQSQNVNVKINMDPIQRQQDKSLEIDSIPFLNMLYYKKPQKKPEPPPFPGALNEVQTILKSCNGVLRNADITWVLLRSFSRGLLQKDSATKQVFPNWVAFNMRVTEKKNTITAVQYAPAIHAKPSDLNTVYTTLIKGQELAKECGQEFSIQTFDQQLFALGHYVKFDLLEIMENSIIRLGSFHTGSTFIACINILYGDAFLRDMLAGSEVYAGKTVDNMLAGKQFYRGLRGLMLCYEVLVTLLLENFFDWLEKNDKDPENTISDLMEEIKIFQSRYSQNKCSKDEFMNFVKVIDTVLIPRLNEFIEIGCKESPTFKFVIGCLQSMQILFDFIRAERDSNWDSHLIARTQMLPYFFICKRPNYSRYGTLYVVDMLMNLPEEVKRFFQAGHFAINFTAGAFRGIFSDMATEMTVIKNTKAADSGILGLTRKPAAILRWTLTQNVVGEYASAMRGRSNVKDSTSAYENYVHEGEKPSLFNRDEQDFFKMFNYVKAHMTDPFSLEKYSPKLINISSGLVAPSEVSESLLSAVDVGTEKMFEFLNRLEKTSEKSFHDAITRSNLKTFSDVQKNSIYKINGKETRKVIKPDIVFKRALMINKSRPNVNLQMIMTVPLTNVPSVLFKPDGSRRKTAKYELMHLLEKNIINEITLDAPPLQKHNCVVIDGMAVLQALNASNLVTFNDVGRQILEKINRKLQNADEVHLIFDRYDDDGINPKQEERFTRYGNGGQAVQIMGNRHVRDFKKVLANNENKSNLTSFICEYLQKHLPNLDIMSNEAKKVFVAGGVEPRENTYLISKNNQCADLNLVCNQIDADTRIIFHVCAIQSRYDDQCQIIVESPDTDVFVLLLSHYKYFDNKPLLWFYTGKIERKLDHRRYIPIHTLYEKLGPEKSLALMTLHALSGCDTVSSFNNIGKKTAYAAFSRLSTEDIDNFINIVYLPVEKALLAVTKWLNFIYTPAKLQKERTFGEEDISINILRYNIACIKDIAVDKLPPSEPALMQHLLRVKWQVNEWSQARFNNITSFDPTQYGWIRKNNILSFNYFEGDTAIQMLQKFICSCTGKSPCKDEEMCSCLSQGFECCELCACSINCNNQKTSDDHMDLSDEYETEH